MRRSILLAAALSAAGCQQAVPEEAGEANKHEAKAAAAELEAAARNASDPTQEQVMQNQANALREVSKGDEEEVPGEVQVTGQ